MKAGRLWLAVIRAIGLITITQPSLAIAGFPVVEANLKCLPDHVGVEFNYKNNSRGVDFVVDTGPYGEQAVGRCWISDYPRKPILAGQMRSIFVQCEVPHRKTTSYFSRSVKVQIQHTVPGTKALSVSEQVLTVSGRYGDDCGSVAKHRPPSPSARSFIESQRERKNCPTVRFDEKNSPLSRVAVRDQRENGSCYAASAATLFDYMRLADQDLAAGYPARQANAPVLPEATSTLSTALDYKSNLERKLENDAKVLDSGLEGPALELLIRDGACSEAGMRERLRADNLKEDQFNSLYAAFAKGLAGLIERLKEEKEGQAKDGFKRCLGSFRDRLHESSKNVDATPCERDAFVNLTDSLVRSAPMLACGNPRQFLEEKLKLTCSEPERIRLSRTWKTKEISLESERITSADRFAAFESAFIRAPDRHPMLAGIKSCILQASIFDLVPNNLSTFLRTRACKESGHAVIVAGQFWNPKTDRCEVIVRNSWGKVDCGDAYLSWDCDPAQGEVFIEKSTFVNALDGLTTISAQ